jgi:hypothetical protein
VARDGARDLVDWLDAEAEQFSSATTREYYLNYAGLKDDLALAPIYERHATLFARETVDRALALRTRDARARHLREFAVDGYLEQAAKELTEEIARCETADTVAWDGEQVPYRSVQSLLMNEPDAGRRHELDARRAEVTASRNDLRERRWDLLHARARELGFASYAALCDRLGRLGLERLRGTMERFLWETEAPYRERLASELRGVGVEPSLGERSDFLRLFRSPEFDALFPRERMLPALEATLRGLGVDVDHQPNVILDAEERPRKTPRAFCAPVDVPGEIYLVIAPTGGADDYRALFHEAGHAQHFAHVHAGQPFAFRGLGDNSVTEGFAFVLEHLLYSAAWLRRYLDIADAERYLSLARFQKFYFLRRYAAKLLYELGLHTSDDVRGQAKRYADLLTTHVGVRYSPADYLSDVDAGFYCARYLRAWTFEAQVRAVFNRRWGEEWFLQPEGGAALRRLWSYGQRYSADELVRKLGERELDPGPVTADVAGV